MGKMNAEQARDWIHANWTHLVVTKRLGEVIAKYMKTYGAQVVKEEAKFEAEIKSGEWIKGTIDEEAASTFNGKL